MKSTVELEQEKFDLALNMINYGFNLLYHLGYTLPERIDFRLREENDKLPEQKRIFEEKDENRELCKCGHALELCPSDWPWNEEFWICPKCDSTYVKEEKKNVR